MKITIDPMLKCLRELSKGATKPQHEALMQIERIVHHAQSTAYARPPQPSFTHREPLASALVNELTEVQVKALEGAGIRLYNETGMLSHQVLLTFHP